MTARQKITTILAAILGYVSTFTSIGLSQSNPQLLTFEQWCYNKTRLPVSSQYTIEILLKQANTSRCDLAGQRLAKLTNLDLRRKQITDVAPLSALTQLTELYLAENKISDVAPLARLTDLVGLTLNNNQISNVKPLSNLINAEFIYLFANPIQNRSCPLQPASVCHF